MSEGPLFFAGVDRSGIGLLAELFDAHPEMAITRRTNFWDFFADRHGDLSVPWRLDRCLADMLRYTRIRRLEPDVDRLKAEFAAGQRTYPRLFRLLEEQYAQRQGKRRWGDKSLGSERHAERILSAYPDATMFHVLRDPRDRYASRSMHRRADRGGAGSATAAWLWSVGRAKELSAQYAGRYRVVRYEDLVGDPTIVLASLCEQIDLDYSPAMLQLPDGTHREVHTRSVGRYALYLVPGDIHFIERTARRSMELWGYEPGNPPWDLAAMTSFIATRLPMATAGFLLWRPWAAFRAGRGVPSSRRTMAGVTSSDD